MSDKDKPKDQDKTRIAIIGADLRGSLPQGQRLVPLSTQPEVKAIKKKNEPKEE
jgi:ATP sulfurylase